MASANTPMTPVPGVHATQNSRLYVFSAATQGCIMMAYPMWTISAFLNRAQPNFRVL
jgi:hypothetical protein